MYSTNIKSVRKRSGEVVDFVPQKIHEAIRKAFIHESGAAPEDGLGEIALAVVNLLNERYKDESTPSVEDVQNVVEQVLMENGHFGVAKAYIIYRYEHQKQRQEKVEEVIKKIEEEGLYITKRNGKRELFSMEKLKASLAHSARGYEKDVDVDGLAQQCRSELYEDIKSEDIERALVMVVRSSIERDPAYSKVAARILLNGLHKNVIGIEKINFADLDSQLRRAFVESIHKGAQIGKLDPRMLLYDLSYLSIKMDFSRNDYFEYLGVQTLADRYFIQNPVTREKLETPQIFWMRVAMGLAINEPASQRDARAVEFYENMSQLLFVPSTPTLFHAGTAHPQLSSCYLTTIEDSLDHIFKCIGDNAQLSKWSGGIGNDWTNLRGVGALIKGTGVESQGVVPFLKIANDTTVAINRSGRRRGATCAYMENWHIDFEDFIELRKNTGDERRRTHDMNTAAWIPDLFMKRVKEDGQWTLFSPDETPDLHHVYGKEFEGKYIEYERRAAAGEMALFKIMPAKELWKKMLTMLFETGHPWITFKDPSNIRSPQDHVGVVHSSNLCTEITLNTSAEETAVCNLGSVNLSRHVGNGELLEDKLRKTITTAMRMLDNVVDANFYPTIEAKNSNMRHRPIGLGVMGYQDALYELGIQFDSEECVAFADRSQEIISYYALLTSSQLAQERGAYGSYEGSKWDRGIFPVDTIDLLESERGVKIDTPRAGQMDWTPVRESVAKYGLRNSNHMAVAPTATIANISGCTPTIEPIYKNIYVKSNASGDFTVVNKKLVEELKALNLWDDEMLGKLKYNDGSIAQITEIPEDVRKKYKEVFEIDGRWLMRAAAARGKWIDQSQSMNVFYAGKSGKDISDLYHYAWDLGLKTTYYLRSLAASQVEKSTVATQQFGDTHKRSTGVAAADVVSAASAPSAVQNAAAAGTLAPEKPKKIDLSKVPAGEVKLCRIEDPDCEACQ